MKTKNIFRMLLMAVVLLMGANNVKADEITLSDTPSGTIEISADEFASINAGSSLRVYMPQYDLYVSSNNGSDWQALYYSPYNDWVRGSSDYGNEHYNKEGSFYEFELTDTELSRIKLYGLYLQAYTNIEKVSIITTGSAETGSRTYTLIYEVDNTIYATQNYEANATITPPEDPQKEGHTFTGWDGLPDDMTMPSRNITATAQFTVNKYTLTYMLDGTVYKTYEVEYGATINPEQIYYLEGRTFNGWDDLPETMPANDVTVNALITKNEYTLTWKISGETSSYLVQTMAYGDPIVEPVPAPTKVGSTFKWDNHAETMPANNVTITGYFTAIDYTITANSAEHGSYNLPQTAQYGNEVSFYGFYPDNGYELDNVTVTAEDGTDIEVTSSNKFTMPAQNVSVTVTFKLISGTKFNVSNANNTQNGSVWADKDTAEAGATVTLGSQPNTGYELDHYVVTGENGTTIEVNGNQFLMPASEVWYSAVFKQIDYTVTITEPTNGTVTADKTTGVHYGEEVTLTVTAAEGYELDVLTVKDANNADVTVTVNKFTMPASNVTVTATFKQTGTEPVGPTAPEDIENEHSLWAGTPVTATDGDGHLPETLPASLFADIKAGDTFRVYISNISNDNWKLWITNSASGWDTQVFSDFAGGNITKDNVGSAYHAEDGYGYFEFTCSAETAASLKANGTQMSFTWMTVIKVSYISNESVEPDTYAITVDSSDNGTVAASAESATEGTEITLTITADEGYELDNLTVKAGNDDVTVTDNKFTMPASDVTITATFKAVAPQYEEGNVTYTLSLGEVFAPAQTVAVNNGSETVAVITYSEPGGNLFNAPRTDGSVSGYTAFTEGNGVNGNKSGGTFYTIVPKYNGTISVAVVLNNGKEFYILEDGTALSDYNGITVATKYSGTYEFDVKAGSSYKIYCSGSKLGFYGFNYTYNTETSATLKSIPALSFASNASATVGTDISSPALSTNPSGLSVTYYSSDTDIATVNSETGEVTPVREGSTTIVAAFAGNGNYFSNASYYSLTVEAEVVEVEYETAPIGSTGYATFSCAKALDFSGVSGISAYVVKSIDGTDAILEKVTGTVAAETGLLIVGSTKDIPVAESGNTYANNLLKPVLGSSQTINGSGQYVLTTWGAGVRFAETVNNSATVEPGHAYLDATASGARIQFINIVWDENATAINSAKAASEGDTVIYNLQGQRVVNPTKGVYIINGKKVAIK